MDTFGQVGSALTVAVFLAIVANRLVEGLVKPVFTSQGWDCFYLLYISWVVGSALVAVSQVNLFAPWIPDALIGRVLSAIVAGGGANLLNDLFGGQGKRRDANENRITYP